MNVAFRSASFSPTAWAVDNRESDLHLWPHTVGRNRDLGSRNPAISLMPAAARVRRMELKEAAWTTQEHAYRAEIERLNAKAEARKPHNRLRRLGEKLLRLPDRRTGSRTPEEAVALPVRVRAPGGAWIHVDPLDRRAQKLIQSDGNLNPPLPGICCCSSMPGRMSSMSAPTMARCSSMAACLPGQASSRSNPIRRSAPISNAPCARQGCRRSSWTLRCPTRKARPRFTSTQTGQERLVSPSPATTAPCRCGRPRSTGSFAASMQVLR